MHDPMHLAARLCLHSRAWPRRATHCSLEGPLAAHLTLGLLLEVLLHLRLVEVLRLRPSRSGVRVSDSVRCASRARRATAPPARASWSSSRVGSHVHLSLGLPSHPVLHLSRHDVNKSWSSHLRGWPLPAALLSACSLGLLAGIALRADRGTHRTLISSHSARHGTPSSHRRRSACTPRMHLPGLTPAVRNVVVLRPDARVLHRDVLGDLLGIRALHRNALDDPVGSRASNRGVLDDLLGILAVLLDALVVLVESGNPPMPSIDPLDHGDHTPGLTRFFSITIVGTTRALVLHSTLAALQTQLA
mmetsp:Transcript_20036/g.52411  ORF Transcript_20036/g.52411 Transcript_20036/m.52411 type:complete len:304 (-) Transcript_20036:1144-2055(-)